MNVKKFTFTLLSLLLILGMLGGCGFTEEDEYTEVLEEEEEYVEIAAGEDYTHSSGAFSFATPFPLEEEAENGALFWDDGTMATVLFGTAPIEVSEETMYWIAAPLLHNLPEFEFYELAEDDVQPVNDGYMIHFAVTPLAESDMPEMAGDVFVTQDGDTLYTALLLSEDYADVSEAWMEALASFTTGEATAELASEEEVVEEEEETTEEEPVDLAEMELEQVHSGFEPTTHGFSFFNYGDEINPTDLTPAEMERMFGDAVCAAVTDGTCVLTPAAQQWMEENNNYMGGGHCYGMAALSSLMYYDRISPADFGGSVAYDLALENESLQREIAYWWAMQGTYPGVAERIDSSPTAVVEALVDAFEEGKDATDYWVIAFYKRDFTGGHAVTPLGVENLGDGRYNILVYDNNFPNETRIIEIDTNADTWQYEGSPNPEIESDLYEGDANSLTLEVIDLTNALEPQVCHFCAEGASGETAGLNNVLGSTGAAVVAEAPDIFWQALQELWDLLIYGETDAFYQVWLTGDFELLVVDDWDRRVGIADGEFVNEIPGAYRQHMKTNGENQSPVYNIPVGLSFEVLIDASNLEDVGNAAVSMIGPGYYLDVTDIWLEPGEFDVIGVHIDKSRHQLTYSTGYSESPTLEMGVETEEAAYAMQIIATELIGGEDGFDIGLDTATGEFIINTSHNTDPSTYDVLVLRIADDGEYVFGAGDLVLDPENTVYIAFTDWAGPGSGLPVQLDYENDGEIDDELEFPDVSEAVDFYAEAEETTAEETTEEETTDVVEEPQGEEGELVFETTVMAGQGLFIFYNESEYDVIVEVGEYTLEVPAGETGGQALDPGDYTWWATTADGSYESEPEAFTMEADGIYEASVE
jgi:hypothetical protein